MKIYDRVYSRLILTETYSAPILVTINDVKF